MDNVTRLLMQGAAGAAGDGLYIEDVFSTYLWRGDGVSGRTITNNIEFDEGAMVWIKNRSQVTDYPITDTVRGAGQTLYSNSSNANYSHPSLLTAFTASGFTVGNDGYVNSTGDKYTSWTFRKQPGFFDVVTYNGNSNTLDSGESQSIAHSLGSTPGLILVKKTTGSQPWAVYHRSLGNTKSLFLESTSSAETLQRYWNNTSPTSTHFTVGSSAHVNRTGESYVAYIFAHDDQQFGDNEDQSYIKCGSYSGNGSESNGTEVNLGWEPQWLLVKNSTLGEHWVLIDSMRGLTDNGSHILFPNRTNAEDPGSGSASVTPTGFKLHTTNNEWNGNNHTYVYMAIRRPDPLVGKPAKVGTDVFTVVNGDTDGDATTPWLTAPFIVDFALFKGRTITHNWGTSPRLTQGYYLSFNQNRTENNHAHQVFDYMNGFNDGTDTSGNYTGWLWKRHAGFDVVTYKGGGDSNRRVNHSLGKVPEMIWVKNRDTARDWVVYHKGLNGGTNPENYYIVLNSTSAEASTQYIWSQYPPTTTQFEVDATGVVNDQNEKYLALLFASVNGISKVGSYTGNGTGQTITTGFQPRFLLIKNYTYTGGENWRVLDTVRGWGSGNDCQIRLSSDNPQSCNEDWGAPTSTGFTLSASGDTAYNKNGNGYIYYAHA